MISKIKNAISFRWVTLFSAPSYVVNKFEFGVWKLRRNKAPLALWVKLISGAKVKLGVDKVDEYILADIFEKKIYFVDNMYLNTDELVLDVGAHHGIYATEICYRFKNICIYCIEPDPEAIELIYEHKNINKINIEVVPFAIGVTAENSYLIDNNDGSWGKTVEKTSSGNSILIQTKTLSEILKGVNLNKIQLVKSNCEGGEFVLIEQIINLRIKPRYIILMIHPNKGNLKELVNKLTNYGYDYTIAWESNINPCYHFFIK
jgi:FkbM family methyltransferase